MNQVSYQRVRQLAVAGLLIAVGLGIQPFFYLRHLSLADRLTLVDARDDTRYLYLAARAAHWNDLPHWWIGTWNYPGVYYYRPLASTLFFLEYKAFGSNFNYYYKVTMLFCTINAALLYLLTLSMFRSWPRARIALGIVAVLYGLTFYGPLSFAVSRCVGWWPAQNDVCGLTFGLASLLALQTWLNKGSRRWLALATILFVLGICFKEMGYVVAAMAVALASHARTRLKSTSVAYLGAAGVMWILRRICIPNAWTPQYFHLWVINKLVLHLGGPLGSVLQTGIWWPLIAAMGVLAMGYLAMRGAIQLWVALIAVLILFSFAAQFGPGGGSWALWLVDDMPFRAVRYTLAVALAIRYGRAVPALVTGALLWLSFLPILHFGAPHYFYWSSAMLGLADAGFAAALWQLCVECKPVVKPQLDYVWLRIAGPPKVSAQE